MLFRSMTFSDSAVTDVVVDTSGETASYGAAAADQLREQLMVAGSAEIDGVSGSTITSDAVMKAAKSCYAQAKGEATVTSVQLPTGDENDWLGKEPDIDEAAITETVDTDILIVGAGNGGIFAAAAGITPVELHLDARAAAIIDGVPAAPQDFDTEYLDYKLSVAVVDDVDAAIAHIAKHSTHHSEAFVTADAAAAQRFTTCHRPWYCRMCNHRRM